MNNCSFVAIDFETANYNRNSACQIGLVRYINGKETDTLSSLIKPPTDYFVKEFTENIHGISYDDVKNEMDFKEVWENKVIPFLEKGSALPLVAHNACFDMEVIRQCCKFYNMKYPKYKYFDSLLISRKVWPQFTCHKLTDLGKQFSIVYKAHDALEDSRTCGSVVLKAAEECNKDNILDLLKFLNMKLCKI